MSKKKNENEHIQMLKNDRPVGIDNADVELLNGDVVCLWNTCATYLTCE